MNFIDAEYIECLLLVYWSALRYKEEISFCRRILSLKLSAIDVSIKLDQIWDLILY